MKKFTFGWSDINTSKPCSDGPFLVYVDNKLIPPYIDIFNWDTEKADWTIGPIPGVTHWKNPIPGVTHWKNLPRAPDA